MFILYWCIIAIIYMRKSGSSERTCIRCCDLTAHGIDFFTLLFSATLLLCEKALGSYIISLYLTKNVSLVWGALWWCPWGLLCGQNTVCFLSSLVNKQLQTIFQPSWAPKRCKQCFHKGHWLTKLGFEFVYQLFNSKCPVHLATDVLLTAVFYLVIH